MVARILLETYFYGQVEQASKRLKCQRSPLHLLYRTFNIFAGMVFSIRLLDRSFALGFDLVLPLKHLINLCKIVCSFGDCLWITLGRVALLQMSLFS